MQIKKLEVDRCIAVINQLVACEVDLGSVQWDAKQWSASMSIGTPHGWQALEAISNALHLGDYSRSLWRMFSSWILGRRRR